MQVFMPKYTVETLRAIFSHPPIFSFYWTSIHCKVGNQIGSTNGCCYFAMPCCSHLYHLHTFDIERAWGLEILLRNSPLDEGLWFVFRLFSPFRCVNFSKCPIFKNASFSMTQVLPPLPSFICSICLKIGHTN